VADESTLDTLIGKPVVLDTAGPLLYIGTLERLDREGYWLTDADVHDRHDGHASKELYVLEAKLHGVRPNRKRVFVMRAEVVSLSLLEDVVT
jgi:esterase/lipase superfamily enzyme